jgi:hypothetical protein
MKKLTTITAFAAVAALAIPAVAPAKAPSPATSKTVVAKRIKDADAALAALRKAARRHNAGAATSALRASRRSTALASVSAQQLAGSGLDPVLAAKLLKLVGGQELQNFDVYASLIDDVVAQVQSALALGANNAAIGKQAAIEKLTALLPTLPAELQPALAAVIASLGAGGSGGLSQITGLLQGGTVPPQVQDMLTTVLQTVHANVTEILGLVTQQLQGLPAASIVAPILAMVTSQVDQIFSIINGVLGGSLGGVTTGTTGTTGSTGSTGTPPAGLPGLGSLLGGTGLPGLGFLQGILSNLPGFNMIGGFGGLNPSYVCRRPGPLCPGRCVAGVPREAR